MYVWHPIDDNLVLMVDDVLDGDAGVGADGVASELEQAELFLALEERIVRNKIALQILTMKPELYAPGFFSILPSRYVPFDGSS